ncbi:MAG: hypothetical protein V4510_07270 [bacterium]
MTGPAAGASLFAFDATALRDFFAVVPHNYAEAQRRVNEPYQRLLYTVEHPLSESTTDAIDDAFGLPHPAWTVGSRTEAIAMLDGLRYPDTSPISDLRSVAGLDLRILSHYLHFFHHAYPIYTRASCAALERLGAPVPYTKVRNADIYALYIAAIEELKERIPFWDVPETNVYLTRIVQAALDAFGARPTA